MRRRAHICKGILTVPYDLLLLSRLLSLITSHTKILERMADEKTSPPAAVDMEKDVKGHVDPQLKEHAQDADEALKAFQELQGEAIELDAATNKRLLRIIDWHMMPIMCFVYGMNYLDSMLFFASNLGIRNP